MSRRLLPFPLLSLGLFTMWVLLTGFSPGHVVIAAIVACTLPRLMLTLKVEPPRIRFTMAIPKLLGIVLYDVIRSNLAVARIVLFKRNKVQSGFIYLPIEVRSPHALAILAIILTATPGTLWLAHNARTGHILLHVLDLVDEDAWTNLIKNRYEALLLEIFE